MMTFPDTTRYFERLAEVYAAIGREYDETARFYGGFSCAGCGDNCCTTVFYHYTVIEHRYLLEGFERLDGQRQAEALARAEEYVRQLSEKPFAETSLTIMCPVNFDGLCGVYGHRPLICRIHGLPARLSTPHKGVQQWKGCLRFQAMHGDAITREMDRTGHYQQIALIEADIRRELGFMKKYRRTIAGMILDRQMQEALA